MLHDSGLISEHVEPSDVRARPCAALVQGTGAPLNAAGRAGAPRPLPGRVLMDVSSPTIPSLDVERGLFFPRDRLRLQAVDRACVVVRIPIHLLHVCSPSAARELAMKDHHRADKDLHATDNVHER